MRRRKTYACRMAAYCMAAGLGLGRGGLFAIPPLEAIASPEFAYPPEKWAALRDNVMEYEELADLVHEYNATVINNRLEYDE